jgi:hypothetical protein
MASTKVKLRTLFEGDVFIVGDTKVTYEGTEFPTRAKADEALEAAKVSGVKLQEMPADEPAKTEGGESR